MNRQKSTTLDLLANTYCRIQVSKINGVGVYAIRDIPAQTELFPGMNQRNWITLTTEEISGLPQEVLKMIDDFFVIENGAVSLPKSGLIGMDMSFYMNHSTKPNTETIDGGFTFVSARKIKKGEELTASYSAFDPKY